MIIAAVVCLGAVLVALVAVAIFLALYGDSKGVFLFMLLIMLQSAGGGLLAVAGNLK